MLVESGAFSRRDVLSRSNYASTVCTCGHNALVVGKGNGQAHTTLELAREEFLAGVYMVDVEKDDSTGFPHWGTNSAKTIAAA